MARGEHMCHETFVCQAHESRDIRVENTQMETNSCVRHASRGSVASTCVMRNSCVRHTFHTENRVSCTHNIRKRTEKSVLHVIEVLCTNNSRVSRERVRFVLRTIVGCSP